MNVIAVIIAIMTVWLAIAVIAPIYREFILLFCDKDEEKEDEEDEL